MSRKLAVGIFVAPLILSAVWLVGQAPMADKVEMNGLKATVKMEEPISGFLTPLNGKLKMRATEAELAPGGSIGDHLHAGPGIRFLRSGELTVVDPASGQEKVYRAGDYFYETGDVSLHGVNKGSQPVTWVTVELLPASHQGSAMLPLSKRPQLEEEGKTLQKMMQEQ